MQNLSVIVAQIQLPICKTVWNCSLWSTADMMVSSWPFIIMTRYLKGPCNKGQYCINPYAFLIYSSVTRSSSKALFDGRHQQWLVPGSIVLMLYYYCAPVQWLPWPLIVESRTICMMYPGSLFNYLLSMCLAISLKKMESYLFTL